MIGGTTTFAIPTVQPLQSGFDVGGQSVTEKYRRIVFSSTQAVANVSVAATGATGGPMPTGSTQPFVGAPVKTKGHSKVALAVLGAFVLIIS